jgi:hypothetical protein
MLWEDGIVALYSYLLMDNNAMIAALLLAGKCGQDLISIHSIWARFGQDFASASAMFWCKFIFGNGLRNDLVRKSIKLRSQRLSVRL